MEERKYLIGIDLGGSNIRAALFKGSIKVIDIDTKVEKGKGPENVISQIASMIKLLIHPKVVGIGIGAPAYVDVENGIVYDAVNLEGWDEIPLRKILQKSISVPVYINNDANCFTLGEKYFGRLRPYNSAVGLTLGTGLGVGIIINNKLYNGKNCGAGEISALPYLDKDYEYYASSHFFQNEFGTTARELFEKLKCNDSQNFYIFQEYGRHFGEFLKVVLTAYDPEAIVLGGSISKAFSYFSQGMYESLEKFHFKQYLKNLTIEVSNLENAALYGAAQLCNIENNL